MATITLNNVSEALFTALQQEAEVRGTTVEVVARERLTAWQDAFDEHDERNRALLHRLQNGERIDGPIAEELVEARADVGFKLSNADVNAIFSDGDQ